MKILILNENYPNPENIIGDQFVHVRAKEYAKNHELRVFSFFRTPRKFLYEGITIEIFSDQVALRTAIEDFIPDRIIIHFFHSWMLDVIIRKVKVSILIWVHGYEALGWYRRLFNYTWYSPILLEYIKKNTYQQLQFKKLIRYSNKSENVQFVFVSDWMRRTTEWDTLTNIKQKTIIPNPIDTKLFEYKPKFAEHRNKILLLRSFSSNKYANDISVKAILLLSKKVFFSELQFTIIGEGQLFKKITEPLGKFQNIDLQEKLVKQNFIPELHQNHGIFLCPTRQDAQGVSMCEAMSSGLVPITTNNTAIPEFVVDKRSGFLTNSAKEVADAIEFMYHNPEVFQRISIQAGAVMRRLCSLESIISKELELIEN